MSRTNEENLDLFADLLEPVTEIISDGEISASLKRGEKPVSAVKIAIKRHKGAVVQILALIDGEDPATYVVGSPLVLFNRLIAIMNNPDIQELFTGQGLKTAAASSGSATATTKGAD